VLAIRLVVDRYRATTIANLLIAFDYAWEMKEEEAVNE
jgi:hypothetical protein